VTEEWRGKGIGKLLFEKMIEEARELGLNGMTWQVLDWNGPAIKFYKRYEAAIGEGWLNGSLSKEQIMGNNR
jgi:GNAT superfamily N-acetyltransferase